MVCNSPRGRTTPIDAIRAGLARDWDDVYGDRMIKLVFIGQHLDRDAIASALDACLEKE